jgi:hypothetical protein
LLRLGCPTNLKFIQMVFKGLTNLEKNKLEYEVVPHRARLLLTRLLRDRTSHEQSEVQIIYQNRAVNIARNILGASIYVLDGGVEGLYHETEYGWHYGEIELVMLRPNTAELVETLADFIQEGILDVDDVNEILSKFNLSFGFNLRESYGVRDVQVSISAVEEIELDEDKDEHLNIRVLISRMENSLHQKDFPAVLHASASIFETLAKDVISLESVDDKTLASFFDRYRKDSKLPEPILDYVLEIYKQRNIEPLAGHGSRKTPTISEREAVILVEMTKAFVRIERSLSKPEIK